MATYLDRSLSEAITAIHCDASSHMYGLNQPENEMEFLSDAEYDRRVKSIIKLMQLKVEAYVMQKYGDSTWMEFIEVMDTDLYSRMVSGEDVRDIMYTIITDTLPAAWKGN